MPATLFRLQARRFPVETAAKVNKKSEKRNALSTFCCLPLHSNEQYGAQFQMY
jgi:hypothetical protein